MSALVLALNPSIDAEWQVDGVQWEEKNMIQSERRWAGGKGINVARWLSRLGDQPRLLLPLGGSAGDELAHFLREEGLAAEIISLRESSRVNVIVTTARQGQLRFNQPGPKLLRREWQAILRKVRQMLARASCLVLSGSLPRGVPIDAYAKLVRIARGAGVKTLLDCDGDALRAAVPARPFLVKPNEYELAQWAGRRLHSEAALLRAAGDLSAASGGWVLVSRGPKRSFLMNRSQAAVFSACPQRLKPVTTVGAGDALLAAVVRQIELGAPPCEWLRWGTAVGTVATQFTAGQLPRRGFIAKLQRQVIAD